MVYFGSYRFEDGSLITRTVLYTKMADSDGDSVYKTVYLIDFFRFFCDQVVDSDPKWRKDRSTVVNRARFVGLKRSMTEMNRTPCACKTFPDIVLTLVLCIFETDRK